MHIAKGGISWIIISFTIFLILIITFILCDKSFKSILLFILVLSALLTGLLIIFFRDPNRTISSGIVAVADGIIREVKTVDDKDIGPAWFISTFMNIYHVHVNRMPIDGTIKKINHLPGSHLPAFTKESDRNERVIIQIETKLGLVKIVLIAGTIARRIVPYVKKGDTVKRGDKISLIRLGSRVDIYLQKTMNLSIHLSKRDRIKAGVSKLATPDV